jgi:hypothetical protein
MLMLTASSSTPAAIALAALLGGGVVGEGAGDLGQGGSGALDLAGLLAQLADQLAHAGGAGVDAAGDDVQLVAGRAGVVATADARLQVAGPDALEGLDDFAHRPQLAGDEGIQQRREQRGDARGQQDHVAQGRAAGGEVGDIAAAGHHQAAEAVGLLEEGQLSRVVPSGSCQG